MKLINMPNDEFRLGDVIVNSLADTEILFFEAAIAFAKVSGVKHIKDSLREFVLRGGHASLSIGIDQRGTTREALELLLEALSKSESAIRVFHNENQSTFHTKLYLFYGESDRAILAVGSSNLTEGGLYTNYEVDLLAELNLQHEEDKSLFEQAKSILKGYASDDTGLSKELTEELVAKLQASGKLPTEEMLSQERKAASEMSPKSNGTLSSEDSANEEEPIFPRVKVRAAPRRVIGNSAEAAAIDPEQAQANVGFVMTLMQTDAGRGQTNPGTSPRSPEMFIPLAARDANPTFWGWPEQFSEDPAKPKQIDRIGIPVRLGGRDIEINMMIWKPKHDLRIRSSELREEMQVGDILRIEKVNGAPYEYYMEVVPQGTSLFEQYDSLCTQSVRNSTKRWGYY